MVCARQGVVSKSSGAEGPSEWPWSESEGWSWVGGGVWWVPAGLGGPSRQRMTGPERSTGGRWRRRLCTRRREKSTASREKQCVQRPWGRKEGLGKASVAALAIPGGVGGNVGRGQLSQGCKQRSDKTRLSVRKITDTPEQPEASHRQLRPAPPLRATSRERDPGP